MPSELLQGSADLVILLILHTCEELVCVFLLTTHVEDVSTALPGGDKFVARC